MDNSSLSKADYDGEGDWAPEAWLPFHGEEIVSIDLGRIILFDLFFNAPEQGRFLDLFLTLGPKSDWFLGVAWKIKKSQNNDSFGILILSSFAVVT